MSPRTALSYRPDIDGLRALAVARGGAVPLPGAGLRRRLRGVDVFFVISGYLITGLIVKEIGEGASRSRQFYERRVRRIFPALFAMLAVATVAAALLFFPLSFARFGKSLLATAFFASNFEFWREAGYFDVSADQKPLLHLWSIAVEEQFYLAVPGAAAAHRRPIASRGLRLASPRSSPPRWASASGARDHAAAAGYYLLPSRMWELMLGAHCWRSAPHVPANWQSARTRGCRGACR